MFSKFCSFSKRIFMGFWVLLTLAACDQTRRGLGLERSQPDEFNVLDRPPLSMPPTLDLKPPLQGTIDNQGAKKSREKAENLMMKKGQSSQTSTLAEKDLLKKAGSDQADVNIRGIVNQETQATPLQDDSLAKTILFWQTPPVKGEVIDPVEERKKWMPQSPLPDPSLP